MSEITENHVGPSTWYGLGRYDKQPQTQVMSWQGLCQKDAALSRPFRYFLRHERLGSTAIRFGRHQFDCSGDIGRTQLLADTITS